MHIPNSATQKRSGDYRTHSQIHSWLSPRVTWLSLIGPAESAHAINSVGRPECNTRQSYCTHTLCKHSEGAAAAVLTLLLAQSAQPSISGLQRARERVECSMLYCPLWCWLVRSLAGSLLTQCTMLKLTTAVHQLFPGCWIMRCDTFSSPRALHLDSILLSIIYTPLRRCRLSKTKKSCVGFFCINCYIQNFLDALSALPFLLSWKKQHYLNLFFFYKSRYDKIETFRGDVNIINI